MRATPHVMRHRETGEVKAHIQCKCSEAKHYSDDEYEVTCQGEGVSGYDVEVAFLMDSENGDRVERKVPKKIHKKRDGRS